MSGWGAGGAQKHCQPCLTENRMIKKIFVMTFMQKILSRSFKPYNNILEIDLTSLPRKTLKWTYLKPKQFMNRFYSNVLPEGKKHT